MLVPRADVVFRVLCPNLVTDVAPLRLMTGRNFCATVV